MVRIPETKEQEGEKHCAVFLQLEDLRTKILGLLGLSLCPPRGLSAGFFPGSKVGNTEMSSFSRLIWTC